MTCLLTLILSSCAAAPPPGQSLGPELVVPVVGGQDVTVQVWRGPLVWYRVLPGMVRVASVPLYFEAEGFGFYGFYVGPGEEVQAGQLLARLDTRAWLEQVERQEILIDDLVRVHGWANREWELRMTLREMQHVAAVREAAERFDQAAMDAAAAMYANMARDRLLHAQTQAWQQVEYADARRVLDNMQARLAGAELRAPFDGVVSHLMPRGAGGVVPGGAYILYLAPVGQDVFVELAGGAWAVADHTRRVVGRLECGREMPLAYAPFTREQDMYYTLRGLPRRTRFIFPDGDAPPLGSFVEIRVYMLDLADALLVPRSALFGTITQPYVYKKEDGAWLAVEVTTGARTESYVQILAGLAEGDVLLVP